MPANMASVRCSKPGARHERPQTRDERLRLTGRLDEFHLDVLVFIDVDHGAQMVAELRAGRPAMEIGYRLPTLYTYVMATTAEELLKEALQLPEDERARVAAELLTSLEPEVGMRDSDTWIAEVERRGEAAISGVPGRSWEQTRKHVKERLSRSRG